MLEGVLLFIYYISIVIKAAIGNLQQLLSCWAKWGFEAPTWSGIFLADSLSIHEEAVPSRRVGCPICYSQGQNTDNNNNNSNNSDNSSSSSGNEDIKKNRSRIDDKG